MMVFTSFVPSVFAESKVEDSPYHSYAAIGDSIASGYGPLMGDGDITHFFYNTTPIGAYPNLLCHALGIDVEKDFHSLLCTDQRVTDAYYVIGGEIDKVVDPNNPAEKIDYIEDVETYQTHAGGYGTAKVDKIKDLHNTGEGAQRIINSDLVTIQIGFADIALYPMRHIKDFESEEGLKNALTLELACVNQYSTYYPKLIKRIKELNPDAKIVIVGLYNPFEKIEIVGEDAQKLLDIFALGVRLGNAQLKLWAKLYDCTFADVTGLGQYIDYKTITVEADNMLSVLTSHENHPGGAGHQYAENQILDALGLKRTSIIPYYDDKVSYLAFTSDTHLADNGNSATRLDQWLDNVSEQLGNVTFEHLGICGDLGADNVGRAYESKVQIIMNTVEHNAHVENGIYTTGNHEYNPGSYPTRKDYDPYTSFTRLGEAANTDRYQVFCIGAAQWDYRFNDDDILAMETYLANADKTKPVFIMSHFPIHTFGNRKIGNAAKMIEVLNKYPNVVFIWGHNHTESDTHYGIVYTEDLDGIPINFTYCSAGCMSDADYSRGSGNTLAKGLVAKISEDQIELSYYDKNFEKLAVYDITVDGQTAIAEQTYPEQQEMEANFDNKTYYSTVNPVAGEYAIVVGDVAMTSEPHNGYTSTNNGHTYTYKGFKGGSVRVKGNRLTAGLTENELWTFTPTNGGFTIQNNDGKYLTGHYYQNEGAEIKLEDSKQGNNSVWTYTADKHLKNVGTGKQLNYEIMSDVDGKYISGDMEVFTLRTDANDTILLYNSNQEDETLSDYEAVSSLQDGVWYVITAENKALVGSAHDGYTNDDQNHKNYKYSGLNGTTVEITGNYITSNVTDNMLWKAIKTDGGYYLINKSGKYLGAEYKNKTSSFEGEGRLYTSEQPEIWTIDSGSLKSSNCGKYLNWQNSKDIAGSTLTGGPDFFTIRTSATDAVTIFRAANADGRSVKENELLDKQYNKINFKQPFKQVKNTSLENGSQVIFAYNNMCMNQTSNAGYKNCDKSGNYYWYSGLGCSKLNAGEGVQTITEPINNENIWTVEKEGNVYYFKTNDNKYLSASYTSNTQYSYKDGETDKTVDATGIGKVELKNNKDISCQWKITKNNEGVIDLQNVSCGKYLTFNGGNDVTGTCLEPSSKDDVSVFTVRTKRTHSLYIYSGQQNDDAVDQLSEGEYLVIGDGYALSTERGTGYIDVYSKYRYDGLKPVAITIEDDEVVSPITKDMAWTIVPTEGGYYLQNGEGKYLNSIYNQKTGINVVLTDSKEIWKIEGNKLIGANTGKQLSRQTNKEETNVFTLRTSEGNLFSFYKIEDGTTKTALYKAATGGNVSVSKETVGKEEVFKGSTATAKPGYEFEAWYCEDKFVSDNPLFVPKETGIYEARFTEKTATLKYEEKFINYSSHSQLIGEPEIVSAVTGTAIGCTASDVEGKTFMYWTSDKEGNFIVSKKPTFVPKKIDGIYSDATYYAWYEQENICFCVEKIKTQELTRGKHNLIVGSRNYGEFIFSSVGDQWTIYSSEQKGYLVVDENGNLDYSNVSQLWDYSNGRLSVSIKKKFLLWDVDRKFYLASSLGKLKAKQIALATSVWFEDEVEAGYPEHKINRWTGKCSRCGEQIEN